jgi:nitroreductase
LHLHQIPNMKTQHAKSHALFFELIQGRYSVRNFLNQALETDDIHKIVEAANLAPSAGNLQAYRIHLILDMPKRQMIAKASLDQHFLAQAPAMLLFSAIPELSRRYYGKRGAELFAVQDATIACSFAMLAATSLGLGSVWIGAFDVGAVREALGLNDEFYPVALLALGYPAGLPERSSRRPPREMVVTV